MGCVDAALRGAEVTRRVQQMLSFLGLRPQTACRRCSCRAASSSAWRWPARWSFEPDVLLLDEPLSNLDAKLRVRVRTELKEIQRSLGKTTILVTHDQEEALSISDRIAVIEAGRIRQTGTPSRSMPARPTPSWPISSASRTSSRQRYGRWARMGSCWIRRSGF